MKGLVAFIFTVHSYVSATHSTNLAMPFIATFQVKIGIAVFLESGI